LVFIIPNVLTYIYITLWPIFQIKQEATMSDNLAKVLQFPEERSKEKNDFISFIEVCADPEKGPEIIKEFRIIVNEENANSLYKWFSMQGYDISIEECGRVIDNREMLQDFRINIINQY